MVAESQLMSGYRANFAALLRGFREDAGRSRNNLAHAVGVDPSYLTRIEHGDREPPRQHIIHAIIRELRLRPIDASRLLVAAGYIPPAVERVGSWDATLQAVAEVLGDPELSDEDLQRYRGVIDAISAQWRRRNTIGPRPRAIRPRSREPVEIVEISDRRPVQAAPEEWAPPTPTPVVTVIPLRCPRCGGSVLKDEIDGWCCLSCGQEVEDPDGRR